MIWSLISPIAKQHHHLHDQRVSIHPTGMSSILLSALQSLHQKFVFHVSIFCVFSSFRFPQDQFFFLSRSLAFIFIFFNFLFYIIYKGRLHKNQEDYFWGKNIKKKRKEKNMYNSLSKAIIVTTFISVHNEKWSGFFFFLFFPLFQIHCQIQWKPLQG